MNRIAQIFEDSGSSKGAAGPLGHQQKSDRNYFIAFTPRSGSSWLAGLLTSTKKLGGPGEWFNPDNLPNILKTFPKCDLRSYAALIRHRFKTGNGVSGFEASFFQIKQVEEIVPLEELFGIAPIVGVVPFRYPHVFWPPAFLISCLLSLGKLADINRRRLLRLFFCNGGMVFFACGELI